MNALELRTSEALHRVADGLPVSEDDMDRMEGELMTLLETKPSQVAVPRRSRWDWGVAAVAAGALALGGAALWQVNHEKVSPAAPAPAPTWPLVPRELVGLWQNQPDSPWLWEISADGRITSTDTPAGYLQGSDLVGTVVQRSGDRYTLAEPGATPRPAGDCTGLVLRVTGSDTLNLREVCPAGGGLDLDLERVSPRDPSTGQLEPRFPVEVERHVTLKTQLEGSWVNQESDHVLVIGLPMVDDGLSYAMDDDGDGSVRPDQRGVVSVDAAGVVRAEPEVGSEGGCAPAFSKVVSNTATLVTTSSAGGCFPEGSTQTWLRLH